MPAPGVQIPYGPAIAPIDGPGAGRENGRSSPPPTPKDR